MRRFQISSQPLEDTNLKASSANASAGACVTFEGWVRNRNEGREVVSLEYEAYQALAVKEGDAILAEALDRFDILSAQCIHRVGHLTIGEMAVWVVVTAEHREEAFEACKYIIDEVKVRVPIWKKEYYTDGESHWVNCPRCAAAGRHHHEAAAH
jgi:molybdopterin synthase catalytic subunit